MATGLLQEPDATSLLASKTVLKEVQTELLAALDLQDPAPLRANPIKPSYIDRVAKEPSYQEWVGFLERRLGLDEAGAYQLLHQQARQYVKERYPGQELTGIVGSIQAPPNESAMNRWRFLVDTIENQRLGLDVKAAALLPANVEAFKTCFPESYAVLAEAIRAELNKRSAKAVGKWRPNWWQDQVIRLFLQAPPKAAPPPPAPPPAPEPGKVKLNTDDLEPIPGA